MGTTLNALAEPRPIVPSDGVTLPEYVAAMHEELQRDLWRAGALLFRGFPQLAAPEFGNVVAAFTAEMLTENGEHTPIAEADHVYVPVLYAPEKKLLWHNENSFNVDWPWVIGFNCVSPAQSGGETVFVDSRRMLDELPLEIVERFSEKQVCYIRTMRMGVGRSWQQVFRTESREVAERECRRQRVEYQWLDDEVLQTKAYRPAIVTHPVTGERSWFNQAQHWHPACLEPSVREELTEIFGPDEMPRDCTLGDGSRIEDEEMLEILRVYASLEYGVAWKPGDVVIADNVLTAHGRNQYTGARKLLVAMGRGTPPSGR